MPGPHMPVKSWLSHEEMAELDNAIEAFDRATEADIEQIRTFLLTLRERHQSDRADSSAHR